MADRIVGNPPAITFPSTNVMSWPADTFDENIFALVANTYVYDKTTDTTSLIVSNDGVQSDDTYEITITAGHGFSAGDLCTPQVGNTTNDYSTIAAAETAAATDGSDRLLLWFADTNGTTSWDLGTNEINVGVSVLGMLPNQRIKLIGTDGVRIQGDLVGVTNEITIVNITTFAEDMGIRVWDTSENAEFGGCIIERCRVYSGSQGISYGGKNSGATIRNNIVTGSNLRGIHMLAGTALILGNTVVSCTLGFNNNSKASTYVDNLAVSNGTDYATKTNGTYGATNWSSDATGDVTAKFEPDVGFVGDNSNNLFPQDYRVITTSPVLAVGTGHASLTLDIDGNTRVNDDVGASIGVTLAAVTGTTLFYVGASVYDDVNSWALSSGGAGGVRVPTATDNIIFDGGGTNYCQLDVAINVLSIDMQTAYTGTIDAATDDLNHAVSGNAVFDGTRLDLGNGTWTVGGNWDNKDVTTFNRNSSTLIMNGAAKTFNFGANDLNRLTIDGTISVTAAGTHTVRSILTVNTNNTLTIGVGVTLSDTSQILGGGAINGSGTFRGIDTSFASYTGTITVTALTLTRNATMVAITYGSATVKFLHGNAADQTVTFLSGTTTFTGNVIFENDQPSNSYTIRNNVNDPNLIFQGNVTIVESGSAVTWTKGTGTITLTGAGSGTQTVGFLNKSVEAVIVNSSGATKQLVDDLTTVSMSILDGTLDTNAKDITTTGDFRICSLAAISDLGGSTLTVGDDFNAMGDPDSDISLTGTSAWFLTVTGDNFAAYATVTNCDASGGTTLDVFNGTDGGGNTNVNFIMIADPDFPDVGNVLDDDTVDNVAGTYAAATASRYQSTFQYGEDGTEFTGTFALATPTKPTLVVTDKADGTGVSYTITGADVGTSNATFFFADSDSSTAILGDTIVGNSSGSISITVAGTYWFFTVSSLAGASSITALIRVDITDLGETAVSPQENQVAANGVDTIIQAKSLSPTDTSARTPSWTTRKTIKGWKQDIGSNLRIQYEARDLVVTHKVFVAVDPEAVEGDRLVQAGVNFLIRGVVNQAGLSTLWRLDCEQVN